MRKWLSIHWSNSETIRMLILFSSRLEAYDSIKTIKLDIRVTKSLEFPVEDPVYAVVVFIFREVCVVLTWLGVVAVTLWQVYTGYDRYTATAAAVTCDVYVDAAHTARKGASRAQIGYEKNPGHLILGGPVKVLIQLFSVHTWTETLFTIDP